MHLRKLASLPLLVALSIAFATTVVASDHAFVGHLKKTSLIASTVPANGDQNPYGVAVVPVTTGRLIAGETLVSNFNNAANLQGTGTTIMQVSRAGNVETFATIDAASLHPACPGGVGLTTALVVLRSGWVIVGSLPTSDGTSATMQAGCLIVLNRWGNPVETLGGGPINGPWDMTAVEGDDGAALFVTNVLNGTVAANGGVVNGGTVVRIGLDTQDRGAPHVTSMRVIATGLAERTDPSALVVGPTGVGVGENGVLYIADSVNSQIIAVRDALDRRTATTGRVISSMGAINDPLGLAIAPNGDILTTNGGDGNLVETTPGGQQVAVRLLDSTPPVPTGGAGTLFGLAVGPDGESVLFVDDGNNTLNVLH